MTVGELVLSIATLLNAIVITFIYWQQLKKQKQANYIQIANSLQKLYDTFVAVDKQISVNIDLLFNRRVIGDWRTAEALQQMAEDDKNFQKVYSGNRFLIDITTQNIIVNFVNAAIELRQKLDSLTIAITTMDFEKMDEVYLYSYKNIHEMMDALSSKGQFKLPYVEFDKSWDNYQKWSTKLKNVLDSKKGLAKII